MSGLVQDELIARRPSPVARLESLAGINTRHLVLLFLAIVVIFLTLVPLVMILYGTFTNAPPGTAASFTLNNYSIVYSSFSLVRSAFNSVAFAICSGLISLFIGGYLAWATERTNAPLKPLIYLLVLVPFALPGILTTVAWVFLLSPNAGVLNQIFKSALGLEQAPFNVYSFGGMVWTYGVDHITLPFLLMAAAFRSLDPTLEEAATVSGMSALRTFYQIDLKMMLPSIVAIVLLLFIRGLETFEVPAVIGIPAGIKVFATEIFLALRQPPTNYNLAATFATAYLAVTVIGVLLYLRVTRSAEKFAVITGKAYRPRTADLGVWRFVVAAIALVVLAVIVVLPLAIVIWTSLLPFYSAPSIKMLSLLTLDNYRAIFDLDEFTEALSNTLIVGIAAATIAVVLAVGVAWIVIRTNVPGRKLLDILSFTPIAFPGVVLSLALLWMYLTLPIPIYGTLAILIIAFVTKYIPISLRFMHASLLRVHKELEEAAELCSTSSVRNAAFILFPLILPGLMVAWLYVLTLTFKDLSIPILLSHVGTNLLSVLIFGLFQSGELPRLCAMGVLLTLLIAAVATAARYIAARFSIKTGG